MGGFVMIFQVLRNNKVLMQTTSEKAVPSAEQQREMKKAGLTIKVIEDEPEEKTVKKKN